jgi:hypothetical protein
MLYLRYDFGAVVVLSPLILPEYEALAACRGLSGAKRSAFQSFASTASAERSAFQSLGPRCGIIQHVGDFLTSCPSAKH